MLKTIVITQSKRFETVFWTPDPNCPESDDYRPVEQIHDLTPFEMLLASIGSSTAKDLHTFAQDQGLDLQDVELRLRYRRPFAEANDDIQADRNHKEQIDEEILLYGTLSASDHKQLLGIADQCSIYKMLQRGMEVRSQLVRDLWQKTATINALGVDHAED